MELININILNIIKYCFLDKFRIPVLSIGDNKNILLKTTKQMLKLGKYEEYY